jgi:serine-type D-Ala-D-Ala carboxypeptidase (penicillin-binding protein 5/6)
MGCLTTLLLATVVVAPACASASQQVAERSATARGAAPSVQARSGILIDRRSGKVLWAKNPDLRLMPASCTKIMTALLVLQHYPRLSTMVRVPNVATEHQVVAIGLRPGDRISVKQALYATMVKSANDAAITLAVAVSGTENRFVSLMNRRAKALGLTHTHYVNCRGTPRPGHYSSARDLAKLGRYAMRDPRFRDLVGTKTRTITWPPSHAVTVTSHNRLLDYPWGDGIKTGSTSQSGAVLVGSGKPGLVPLIVVTMREPTRNQEERDAVALFQWGSSLYEKRLIVSAGQLVGQVAVGGEGPVDAVAATDLSAVVRKAASVSRVVELLPPPPLPQRPADGTVLGKVTYRSDGLIVGRVDLLAATLAAASPSP